ncbi:MAG: LCP family protein [Bacillota bacterium]|nr:LCP family protein [Bacillota bacterium]
MKRSYTVPDPGQTLHNRVQPDAVRNRPSRRAGFIVFAAAGLLVGFLLYVILLLDQPLRTAIRFVDPDEWQPVSLDNIQLTEPDQDDLPWITGDRTRVYVHPDFPIIKIRQKDRLVENVLVFGIDARRADDIVCRADSIIIVTIDRRSKAIKLTSIMRDSQVEISGRSRPDRINAAYAYGGVGLLINTLNAEMDLDIQRFAMFDFWSAANLIDMAGGIELDVKAEEIPFVNNNLEEQNRLLQDVDPAPLLEEAGLQRLDGLQAVAWARIRKLDSDSVRTSRQRLLMTTLIEQVAQSQMSALLTLANGGLNAFETNLRLSDMVRIGLTAVPLSTNMLTYRVPEDDLFTVNPSPWMMVVDWEEQIERLHRFIWSTP